jgi:hypothetical protein
MKHLSILSTFALWLLSFAVSAQDYSINTNCSTPFEDIATTGSAIVLASDETRLLGLPFNFQFYDRTYADIRISNNGALLFGNNAGVVPAVNTALPSAIPGYLSYEIQAGLFPHWDDLGADIGNVYTETKGSTPNRRFIIQWNNRNLINSTCAPFANCGITFQIVLYESSGNFAFVYNDLVVDGGVNDNGNQATIGIQRDKNSARQISFNNAAFLTGRTCVTFTRLLTAENAMRYGVQSSNCNGLVNYLGFGGTNLGLSDDATSGTLNLPFDFNFYGRIFKKVRINNNGTIYFEDETGSWGSNRLDVYSTDIDQDRAGANGSPTGGGVFYGTTNVSGVSVFVVEWRNLPGYFASTSGYYFQAHIYADGRIKYVYFDLDAGTPTWSAPAGYRSYGNNANIGIATTFVNQTIFSNEPAIQLDGVANGTTCYCLDFYRPTINYNNMPSCANATSNQATITGLSPNTNLVSLYNGNGQHQGNSTNNYSFNLNLPESYQVRQNGNVYLFNGYSAVPNYDGTYYFNQAFQALSPTFSLPRTPRARMDVFPADTICSTEYAVLFANSGGLDAPAYLWNTGAQTAQAIQADSTFSYRVTITDRHNNCADTVSARIVKSPNALIQSVAFDRIAVGQVPTNLDTMLLRVIPDALLYSTTVNYPRVYEGNYVANIVGQYLFAPPQAGVGIHPVTVAVTDTATGCIHSLAGNIQVLPNPQFLGLDPIYCGNITSATIFRDTANYAYLDTIIGFFATGLPAPNNIQFIRMRRNRMTVSATPSYAGVFPTALDANSFAFNPSLVTGTATITCTYKTQIQVLNVANTILVDKEYTAGVSTFDIQVGTDPVVQIQDTLKLYCEYDNYYRVRVTPVPISGAVSIFTIRNMTTNGIVSIIPNSLGEVYINPALLDTLNDGNTNFRLTYSYTQLGCSRQDSIMILVPEPLNAAFTSLPNVTTYCSSSLPATLIPSVDTSDARVNDNNTFFSVDNISVPNRIFTPGVSLNPTVPVVGNHTIRYEIQDTFGCRNSTEQIFSVNALPIPTITLNNTQFCADASPQTINVNVQPTTGGTGILRQTTRLLGTTSVAFNPLLTPNYTANPDNILGTQTVPDTIGYRYIFTDNNGCRDSVSIAGVIYPAPAITFTNLPDVNCLDTSLRIALNPTPVGVIVQMPGISNTNFNVVNAVFSPRDTVTNQLVSYYYLNTLTGCSNTLFDTVSVISDATTFTFSAGLPDYVCQSSTTPIDLAVTRSGLSTVSARSFSSNRIPNGLTSTGGVFSSTVDTVRFIPSRSDTGNVIISYTANLGGQSCVKTIRDTIYVHKPAPIFLEFIDATNGDSICEYGQTVIFIQNYPQSSTPLPPRLDTIRGSNAIAQQGVQRLTSIRYDFLPNAIVDTNRLRWHSIIADVTDNYGCRVSVTDSIKVISNPIPFINGLDPAYCLGSALDTITGAPQNGNWYNITNNIKYGLIPYSIQSTSIADPLAIPMGAINPINFGFGGTFTFNPTTIDTSAIIYEILYANGCINRDTQIVTVYPLPNLQINPLPNLICSNNNAMPLTALVNGSPAYSPFVQYRDGNNTAGGILSDTIFNPGAVIPVVTDSTTRIIIASYTVLNSGCSDTDTLRVQVRRPPNANILNLNNAYCVNNLPNAITGENTETVGAAAGIASGVFSSLDPGVITNSTNTSATFDPAMITGGSDMVTYTVTAPNGCQNSEVRTIISNSLPSGLSVIMPTNIYCENGAVSVVTGSPVPNAPAAGSFSVVNSANVRIDTSNNNTLNLSPTNYANISGIGNYSLIYRYQDANNCVSYDTSIIEIHPRPTAYFTQGSFCIGDTIRLSDSSYFSSTLNNADSLRFWNWAYQGQSYSNNTTNFLELFNLPAGSGLAQLVATSGANCRDTFTSIVRIFNNPNVGFSTTGGCTDALVNFTPDSTFLANGIDSISNIFWDFGDGTTQNANPNNNTLVLPTTHTYTQAGIYFPSLYIANRLFCQSSDTLRIAISPTVDPSVIAYSENFELTDGTWFQSLPNSQAIWEWGVANKSNLTTVPTGNKVWITSLTSPYPQNTDTWVYGPCFDFTNSIKPMIKLDVAADMYSYDGVAVQYFDNASAQWRTIGANERGVNWYNNASALGLYDYDPAQPYDPATSSLNAWSSSIGFIGTNNATTMQTARYRLDGLKGQNNVQIRIAFGGLNTPNLSNKQGFMFDNVWVGERKRNVLVEHFASKNHTNMGVSTNHLNNLIFNQHNIHDIVLVEYHTDLGTPDDLYYESPSGNNSRRLYYGANNAEVVLDGNAWLGATLSLNSQKLDVEMLQDPDFTINGLNIFINQSLNLASITAEIRAEKDMPNALYRLYPTFVEDSLSWLTQLGFVNQMGVFRQFMPDASGIERPQAWAIGDTAFVQQTWAIDITSLNKNNLEAVLFIQDSSKKILQAAQTRNLDIFTLPQFPVSIEYLDQAQAVGREIFDLRLYPNPATTYTHLEFDAPLQQDYQFQIYDMQGKLLQQGNIPQGSQLLQINVDDYPAATYVVHLFDKQRTVSTRRQFIVARP